MKLHLKTLYMESQRCWLIQTNDVQVELQNRRGETVRRQVVLKQKKRKTNSTKSKLWKATIRDFLASPIFWDFNSTELKICFNRINCTLLMVLIRLFIDLMAHLNKCAIKWCSQQLIYATMAFASKLIKAERRKLLADTHNLMVNENKRQAQK